MYQLLKILYRTVKNFPKEHKYCLGADMLSLGWECLDLAVLANNLPNNQKKNKISELSMSFDKLKMRLRMGQEIDLLSIGQFSHLEENYIQEIGKEIGGWSRWASSQRDKLKWAEKSGGGDRSKF